MVRSLKDGAVSVFEDSEVAGRSAHNAAMARKSHHRLKDLTEQAERDNFYGSVAVEVYFENGRITAVRRRSDGTDK